MQKYNAIAAAFALSLFVAPFAFALESGIAMDFGKSYVLSASSEMLKLTPYTSAKPLLVDENKYWVLYIYSISDKEDVYLRSFDKIVVSDAGSGRVMSEEAVLSRIFKLDYEYAWELNYVNAKAVSYSDIAAGIEAASSTLGTARKNLISVRDHALAASSDETIEAYFEDLLSMLDDGDGLLATLDDLKEQEVANARISENAFSKTGDVDNYLDYMSNYNSTFAKCRDFAAKADAFFNRLSDNDVYAKLTSEEISGLSKISSEGLDAFYPSYVYEDILDEYNKFKLNEESQINDSVKSSRFRIAKADAIKEYAKIQPDIDAVLSKFKSSTSAYDSCDVSSKVRELNSTWANVTVVMERKTPPQTLEYQSAYKYMLSATTQFNAVNDGLASCSKTPTPTPSGKQTGGNFDLPIILIVVAIAIYGFLQFQSWQKRKQEDELEGEGSA